MNPKSKILFGRNGTAMAMNGKNVSKQSKGLNLKMNLHLIETEIQFKKGGKLELSPDLRS